MKPKLSVANLGTDTPFEFLKEARFQLVLERFGSMMLHAVAVKKTLALVLMANGEVIAVTKVKL
jgi:hypothetical protein